LIENERATLNCLLQTENLNT